MRLSAAIGKPFTSLKNFVIVCILTIIPVVNILTLPGYLIRVAKRTMDNDDSLPGFESFGELVLDSLKYFVICIVYAIPSGVVFLLALGSILLSPLGAEVATDVENAIAIGLTTATGLVVLGVILAILGTILAISGVLNYAKTRQFRKAFAVMQNLRNFFTGGFIVAFIVSVVLVIVAIIVGEIMRWFFSPFKAQIVGFAITTVIFVAVEIAAVSLLADAYPKETVAAAKATN